MWHRVPLTVSAALLAAGLAFADGQQPAPGDTNKSAARTRPRIRFGGVYVNAGYTHLSGPFAYPFYNPYYAFYRPWGFGPYSYWPYMYDPFFYGPYIHPGFFTGFGNGGPGMGEIKLRSTDRDAWVYLDGALAGKAEKLKTIWLEPGAYNLEVKSGDKKFGRKVYVLSGKTLQLTADPTRSEVRP